jgi:hypothetical protein
MRAPEPKIATSAETDGYMVIWTGDRGTADVPTAGYSRMFLEFQHPGQIRTAELTALAR